MDPCCIHFDQAVFFQVFPDNPIDIIIIELNQFLKGWLPEFRVGRDSNRPTVSQTLPEYPEIIKFPVFNSGKKLCDLIQQL